MISNGMTSLQTAISSTLILRALPCILQLNHVLSRFKLDASMPGAQVMDRLNSPSKSMLLY